MFRGLLRMRGRWPLSKISLTSNVDYSLILEDKTVLFSAKLPPTFPPFDHPFQNTCHSPTNLSAANFQPTHSSDFQLQIFQHGGHRCVSTQMEGNFYNFFELYELKFNCFNLPTSPK